jgi:hypothetical protein
MSIIDLVGNSRVVNSETPQLGVSLVADPHSRRRARLKSERVDSLPNDGVVGCRANLRRAETQAIRQRALRRRHAPVRCGLRRRLATICPRSKVCARNVEIDAVAANGARPFVVPHLLVRRAILVNAVREDQLPAAARTQRGDICRLVSRPGIRGTARLVRFHFGPPEGRVS